MDASSAHEVKERVTARAFVLVDDSGNTRAVLATKGADTFLFLNDGTNANTLVISSTPSEAAATAMSGKNAATMMASGSRSGAEYTAGGNVITANVEPSGTGANLIVGSTKRSSVHASSDTRRSAVMLTDANGRPAAIVMNGDSGPVLIDANNRAKTITAD